MSAEDRELAAELRALALDAGAAVLAIYAAEFEVRAKADASPVTAADEAAERIILERLARLTPDVPVVAEEAVAAKGAPDLARAPAFWLVDPLDGTREFISRNGEFTVNVALIRGGVPVLGVVHAPALGESFWAAGPGEVWRERAGERAAIAARRPPAEGMVALASRSHMTPDTEAWLAARPIARLAQAGSSLKFCRLAEGAADVYPRLGRTMEWDVAAGHAVLAAAGGTVETLDGSPLGYGKPGFENPWFVARGAKPA
jgi:3'(2'), 5'-bisphosphate nucleotidase